MNNDLGELKQTSDARLSSSTKVITEGNHTSIRLTRGHSEKTVTRELPRIRSQTSGVTVGLNSSGSHHSTIPELNTISVKVGNGEMVSGGETNGEQAFDYKRESYSRKDAARRNLMGYLYTRQPALKRSYTFVAGERPSSETLFPNLMTREKLSAPVQNSNAKSSQSREGRVRRTRSFRSRMHGGSGDVSVLTADKPSEHTTQGRRRLESKVSLPDLINDINNSAKTYEGSTSGLERLNEGIGSFTEIELQQGALKLSKYRPITPGLIEKLNKVKVSSRNRTEQWVKALPLDHRGIHIGEEYREHLNQSPKDHGWLYKDKDI